MLLDVHNKNLMCVWRGNKLKGCDQSEGHLSLGSSWGTQRGFSSAMKKSGLWMVTVQFVFGSLLVVELRSEPKVKTHGEGQQDQRTTTHSQEKGGKNQWELVWRNGLNKQSLQLPAPYYPIIYTAWELGDTGFSRQPLVSSEKCNPRLMPIKRLGFIAMDTFRILSCLMCLF